MFDEVINRTGKSLQTPQELFLHVWWSPGVIYDDADRMILQKMLTIGPILSDFPNFWCWGCSCLSFKTTTSVLLPRGAAMSQGEPLHFSLTSYCGCQQTAHSDRQVAIWKCSLWRRTKSYWTRQINSSHWFGAKSIGRLCCQVRSGFGESV